MLPDEVVTTSPDLAPRLTGEVVISVPFLKFLEFLTIPVIEPSLFCVNLLTIGIPSLTTLGAAFLAPPKNPPAGLATALGCTGSGAGVAFFVAPPPPKMLNVPLPLAGVFLGSTGSGAGVGAGDDPPNKLNVPLPLAGVFLATGAGGVFFCDEIEIVPGPLACFVTEMVPAALAGCLTVFLGAPNEPNPPIPATPLGVAFLTGAFFATGGFWVTTGLAGVGDAPPNKLKVPDPLTGALATGVGSGAFGAGFGAAPPKKPPNAGAGFLATGVGAGSTFLAGAGDDPPKRLKVPLPFGAGALTGAGGASTFLAGLDAPPNKERVGEGLRTGAGLGAGGVASTFFGAGLLPPKRLNAG